MPKVRICFFFLLSETCGQARPADQASREARPDQGEGRLCRRQAVDRRQDGTEPAGDKKYSIIQLELSQQAIKIQYK